LGFFYFYWFFI